MFLKTHLCGVGIVYDQSKKEKDKEPLTKLESRPNGSLYSRQKRQIADACEWMRRHQTKDRKAVIFCLTSPGFTSLANQPKFISSFFDNMKANYGLTDYVWVREMTKKGYPHFHCVAMWHPFKWFLDERKDCEHDGDDKSYRMISKLSRYWSSLFDSDANNSIRLGSYHPVTKKRQFYLTHERHAWYLTKYIGKSIGDGSIDYLCEAGFPQTKYKKAVRTFGMSEQLSENSQPLLFESDYHTTERRSIQIFRSGTHTVETKERVFTNAYGMEITEHELKEYDWRWTGHGETFIGLKKRQK